MITIGSGLTSETDIGSFLKMLDDDNIVNSANGPRDVVDVRKGTINGGDGSFGDPYLADQTEIEEEDDLQDDSTGRVAGKFALLRYGCLSGCGVNMTSSVSLSSPRSSSMVAESPARLTLVA